VERDDVLTFLRGLTREELVDLLRDFELVQGDELGVTLAEAIEAKDAPLNTLRAARAALIVWAGSDAEKKLYADEVDDIARRVAGDLETSGR
jgi:hypothetical protein